MTKLIDIAKAATAALVLFLAPAGSMLPSMISLQDTQDAIESREANIPVAGSMNAVTEEAVEVVAKL